MPFFMSVVEIDDDVHAARETSAWALGSLLHVGAFPVAVLTRAIARVVGCEIDYALVLAKVDGHFVIVVAAEVDSRRVALSCCAGGPSVVEAIANEATWLRRHVWALVLDVGEVGSAFVVWHAFRFGLVIWRHVGIAELLQVEAQAAAAFARGWCAWVVTRGVWMRARMQLERIVGGVVVVAVMDVIVFVWVGVPGRRGRAFVALRLGI